MKQVTINRLGSRPRGVWLEGERQQNIRDLFTVNAQSQNAIALKIGMTQSNLSTALRGERPMPAKRFEQLLGELGVGMDLRPLPGGVWRGTCYVDDFADGEAGPGMMRLFRHFIGEEGVAFGITMDRAVSGLRNLALRFEHAFMAFADDSRATRGILTIRGSMVAGDREFRPGRILRQLAGVRLLEEVEVSGDDFRGLCEGSLVVDVDYFDNLLGKARGKRRVLWSNVEARISTLKKKGMTPEQVLSALSVLGK